METHRIPWNYISSKKTLAVTRCQNRTIKDTTELILIETLFNLNIDPIYGYNNNIIYQPLNSYWNIIDKPKLYFFCGVSQAILISKNYNTMT